MEATATTAEAAATTAEIPLPSPQTIRRVARTLAQLVGIADMVAPVQDRDEELEREETFTVLRLLQTIPGKDAEITRLRDENQQLRRTLRTWGWIDSAEELKELARQGGLELRDLHRLNQADVYPGRRPIVDTEGDRAE